MLRILNFGVYFLAGAHWIFEVLALLVEELLSCCGSMEELGSGGSCLLLIASFEVSIEGIGLSLDSSWIRFDEGGLDDTSVLVEA